MNNDKLKKVLQRYLALLGIRSKRSTNKATLRSLISKNQIVNFFVKNGEWPSKKSTYVNEKKLGTKLENYVCPTSLSYDSVLRRIVLATGRQPSGKRKHNKALFKEEVLEFMKMHGRAPQRYRWATIDGEGTLAAKLDYYTRINGDMAFLGKVYEADPCHRSGIPVVYRPLINSALDVNKPLIRLVK